MQGAAKELRKTLKVIPVLLELKGTGIGTCAVLIIIHIGSFAWMLRNHITALLLKDLFGSFVWMLRQQEVALL